MCYAITTAEASAPLRVPLVHPECEPSSWSSSIPQNPSSHLPIYIPGLQAPTPSPQVMAMSPSQLGVGGGFLMAPCIWIHGTTPADKTNSISWHGSPTPYQRILFGSPWPRSRLGRHPAKPLAVATHTIAGGVGPQVLGPDTHIHPTAEASGKYTG